MALKTKRASLCVVRAMCLIALCHRNPRSPTGTRAVHWLDLAIDNPELHDV